MSKDKIELTKNQAKTIENMKRIVGEEGMIKKKVKDTWKLEENWFLNEMPLDTFTKILYVGYEVKEEFKTGDWRKFIIGKDKWAIGQIDTFAFDDIIFNYLNDEDEWERIRDKGIRSQVPTSVEIKVEKERRVWDKIDRKVGEFHIGDTCIDINKNSAKIYSSVGVSTAKRMYHGNRLKGIYPAESYISLEGDEQ